MDTRVPPGPFYAVAAVGGAALWLGVTAVSERREAWDSSLYWTVAYPACLLLAGVLGYLAPSRPWRWALAVMLVQPVVMILTSDGSFALLPIGLLLFGILALPAMLTAWAGAWMRRR